MQERSRRTERITMKARNFSQEMWNYMNSRRRQRLNAQRRTISLELLTAMTWMRIKTTNTPELWKQ